MTVSKDSLAVSRASLVILIVSSCLQRVFGSLQIVYSCFQSILHSRVFLAVFIEALWRLHETLSDGLCQSLESFMQSPESMIWLGCLQRVSTTLHVVYQNMENSLWKSPESPLLSVTVSRTSLAVSRVSIAVSKVSSCLQIIFRYLHRVWLSPESILLFAVCREPRSLHRVCDCLRSISDSPHSVSSCFQEVKIPQLNTMNNGSNTAPYAPVAND